MLSKLSKYLHAIPNSEIEGRATLLRSFGYTHISILKCDMTSSGAYVVRPDSLTYTTNSANSYGNDQGLWTIRLAGGPCGGDHPNCLQVVPEDHYLCPFCAMYANLPPELTEWLGRFD